MVSDVAMNPGTWLNDARQYLSEVQSEYKKITWPPQNETVSSTVGVLMVVAVVTTVLGVVDFALSRVVQIVLH